MHGLTFRSLILGLALIVGACGFQLRGTVALSNTVETLYLTSDDSYGPLMTELRNRLSANDVELTSGPIGAQYALLITEERQERRVAGLGVDALASAFELTLSARYEVLDNTGLPIARNLSSSVSRAYDATGSSGAQEEALILGEMRTELSQQIMRQLQAVINAAQARDGAPEAGDFVPLPITSGEASDAQPDEAPHGETAP